MYNNIFIIILLLIILLTFIIIVCYLYKKKKIITDKSILDNFIDNNNVKIAVILFGFAPRSFKYTYNSINYNIIKELKKNFLNVDTFHHSLLSKNKNFSTYRPYEKNIKINNNDVYLLNCKKIITEYQEDIHLVNYDKCNMYKNYINNKNVTTKNHKEIIKNHLRALYSELKCTNEFPIYKYDVCIMLSSDSLIKKKININEIKDIYNTNEKLIYTTGFNTARGIANGFYICKPSVLKIISSRYNKFIENCNLSGAEVFLKKIISDNKIKNKYSNMFYLKIRASGKSNDY